jgi:hypothetical protein
MFSPRCAGQNPRGSILHSLQSLDLRLSHPLEVYYTVVLFLGFNLQLIKSCMSFSRVLWSMKLLILLILFLSRLAEGSTRCTRPSLACPSTQQCQDSLQKYLASKKCHSSRAGTAEMFVQSALSKLRDIQTYLH